MIHYLAWVVLSGIFVVREPLALAGGPERVVHVHPGSDGGLRMCDVLAEERIAAWRRVGRGFSAKIHALFVRR